MAPVPGKVPVLLTLELRPNIGRMYWKQKLTSNNCPPQYIVYFNTL